MERAKEFLEEFGEMILKKIEKAGVDDLVSDDSIAEIRELCVDYNIIYKFAEHHHEFECGFLGEHKHSANVMQLK